MTISFKKNQLQKFQLKNETLYFLHIPKTAGTTLINILDKYFPENKVLLDHDWQTLLTNMPIDFSKYQFVRGHFGYSITRIFEKKPLCITILREPTSMMISAYKMLMRQQDDIKRLNIPTNKNISELIEGPYLEGLKNPQTHWLVIEQDILARTKKMTMDELKKYRPEEDEGLLPKYSYSKFLKIAKKRLSGFAFVGIVEKMEESLFLLHYIFGWKPIRNVIQKNVASDVKIELTECAKEKLLKITEVDQKLYKFGKKIFEDRYSKMLKELKEKYYKPQFDKMESNDAVFQMLEKDHFEKTVPG